ncbi:MAG TPA: MgtC/SapB family protein [Bryobacteraceae bacterium]|jgi:uncharacterized membrane protein (DUF4010 family)|nr:MgtC/SapB family protein [Bryobacteraceae bacterium]
MDPTQWLPPEAAKILLVLSLSFLIGLEREEHKATGEQYAFGGVRTFPLIGLIGYSLALLAGGQLLPVTLGFAVVAAFLVVSYRYKLSTATPAGVTSEMSGLATYIIGALVYNEQYWIATTLSVASILLLDLKVALENLTKRIAPDEILTFAKFLLLTAVILPVLPSHDLGPFQINPFKTWLVVVAVSAISYGSYVIGRLTKGQGGIIVAAILGGAYSSTVTTIVLARRATRENRPHLFAGATLIASGTMYLRLTLLLTIFNHNLLILLWPSFTALAALAVAAGWLWTRLPDSATSPIRPEYQAKNPLEFRAAFLFGILFLGMVIITHYAVVYLGKAGLYSLAAVMGVVDVDPFILGMTQSTVAVAAAAILIAAASNNLVKGIYAYAFSDRKTGLQSLALLAALAALGLGPLLWLAH